MKPCKHPSPRVIIPFADTCGECVLEERDALRRELTSLRARLAEAEAERVSLLAETERLQVWVNDLHRGTYINCVYCGHRYGPDKTTPAIMSEVLYKHIAECPKHPLSAMKVRAEHAEAENARLREALQRALNDVRAAMRCSSHSPYPACPCWPCRLDRLLVAALAPAPEAKCVHGKPLGCNEQSPGNCTLCKYETAPEAKAAGPAGDDTFIPEYGDGFGRNGTSIGGENFCAPEAKAAEPEKTKEE